MIIILLIFLFFHVIHLPGRALAIAIVDGILLGYVTWNGFRMGFFSLHVIAMQTFFICGRISELNTTISASIIQSKVSKSALPLKRAIALYRQEHRHLLQIAVTFNNQVSSQLMMVTFLTNIFYNVIMITKLIFELPLLSAETAVFILIILAQTVFTLLACLVQIAWAKALVSGFSIHLLYVSQPMLKEKTEGQKPKKQRPQNSNFGILLRTVMLIDCFKCAY